MHATNDFHVVWQRFLFCWIRWHELLFMLTTPTVFIDRIIPSPEVPIEAVSLQREATAVLTNVSRNQFFVLRLSIVV